MVNAFYKPYKSSTDNNQFRLDISRLGAPTSPMVAKQLEEFGKRLNSGMKNIEVGTISAEKFEFIPDQHFDEIRRLAKVTDSHVSVHGPLMDLSGFPEQGGGKWSEDKRKGTEEQLYSILERSFKLSNGENVPVVFHAGHFQSQEFEKGKKVTEFEWNDKLKKEIPKKPVEKEMGYRQITVVNQDTGDVTLLDYEERYVPGKEEKEIWDPMKRLYNLNETYWKDERIKILSRLKDMEDLKEKYNKKIEQNQVIEKTGLMTDKKWEEVYNHNMMDVALKRDHIEDHQSKLESEYKEIYNKFKNFASEEIKKTYGKELKNIDDKYSETEKELNKNEKKLVELQIKFHELKEKTEKHGLTPELIEAREKLMLKEQEVMNQQMQQNKIMLKEIEELPTPKLWQYAGDFAIPKAAETVSSALARMYCKLKKDGRESQTPFIALENFFTNAPMATAETLKKAVELSRKELAKKLVDQAGLSKDKAEKEAEKLVAATWDVGHINNLRKAGFEGEELKKKVIEETKKIAGVTKHVHITDNFGFHDSHLPPGMGNVPIREIMEELEKKWSEKREKGKLGQEPRAIAEAGGFVAEIGQDPTLNIMEFFASPFYKQGPSPYFWGPEASGIAHRYTPYVETFTEFPQQHFNIYGSSFTTLPKSLGGQVGGEASRFSGTPNQ